MCLGFELALGIVLQLHQFAHILPCRKNLLRQLIHLLIQILIPPFLLPQCRVLLQVLVSKQLEVFLHSFQLILQQDHLPLRLSCNGCSRVIGGDHAVQLILQLFLELDESNEFFLDYIVGLFHLRQSHPMLLPILLLVECFAFAQGKCSPQTLLFPFFFLSLQSQCLQISLEVTLLILQLGDLGPQLLNHQLITVPSFYQALQLVFLLHQLFISQLDPQTSVFVVVTDTAIDPFQSLQLVLQALCLIFDDLIVLFDAFSLSEGAFDIYFESLYLFVIEVLWNQIICGSFDLTGLILKLLDSLTQLQVILLLFLQRPQLLLQLPHRLVLIMAPHGLPKPFRTHFDYSSKMIAGYDRRKIWMPCIWINSRSCG